MSEGVETAPELLHRAAQEALDCVKRLGGISKELYEREGDEDALDAAGLILQSIGEFRRHALWLRGEAEIRASLRASPPAAD